MCIHTLALPEELSAAVCSSLTRLSALALFRPAALGSASRYQW